MFTSRTADDPLPGPCRGELARFRGGANHIGVQMVVFMIYCAILFACFAIAAVAVRVNQIDIDLEFAMARKNGRRNLDQP